MELCCPAGTPSETFRSGREKSTPGSKTMDQREQVLTLHQSDLNMVQSDDQGSDSDDFDTEVDIDTDDDFEAEEGLSTGTAGDTTATTASVTPDIESITITAPATDPRGLMSQKLSKSDSNPTRPGRTLKRSKSALRCTHGEDWAALVKIHEIGKIGKFQSPVALVRLDQTGAMIAGESALKSRPKKRTSEADRRRSSLMRRSKGLMIEMDVGQPTAGESESCTPDAPSAEEETVTPTREGSKKKIDVDGELEEENDEDDESDDHQTSSAITATILAQSVKATFLSDGSEKLRFCFEDLIDAPIENNGHTIRVDVTEGYNGRLYLFGTEYRLQQFHFHAPSEHIIDGKQFDLELHLVHAAHDGDLAVLGILFEESDRQGKSDTDDANEFLDQFWDALPMKMGGCCGGSSEKITEEEEEEEEEEDHPATVTAAVSLSDEDSSSMTKEKKKKRVNVSFKDVRRWLEGKPSHSSSDSLTAASTSAAGIFNYVGSLTTPPFSEDVEWLVCDCIQTVSAAQMKVFQSRMNFLDNSRPVNPLYGRKVRLCRHFEFGEKEEESEEI